ncbi:MAG: phosphoenolpyruvate carboxylase [Candidatus Roizmanbacteria bacterium]
MKRKIPTTMASQHPDHASTPYWHTQPLITTQDESMEAFLTYSDLGIDEYKWDWEGKYVDESVMERLLSTHFDYFKEHQIGRDKFLTFRLPNPKVETEFRLGRAFMGILSASGLSKRFALADNPLFEVILPMTQSAEDLIDIQEAFREIATLKHKYYQFGDTKMDNIEVIPLFEQVEVILNSDTILKEYVEYSVKKLKKKPEYMRPYFARSDPALNSGIIPTVLAIKMALHSYKKFEEENEIPLYPIIGAASLPFRGGLNPDTVSVFSNEYAGIRTFLIQSAFRYDYPKKDVIKAIQTLDTILPKGTAQSISKKEQSIIRKIIEIGTSLYKPTVEKIAIDVNLVSKHIPKRRERVQHVGLFGYSRGVGKVSLPRAIGFTASMYSLGAPPEFIGTGRTIKYATKEGHLPILEKFYINLRHDLERSAEYVNKSVIEKLALTNEGWKQYQEDVKAIEEYLGHEVGPKNHEQREHYYLVELISNRLSSEKDLTGYIEEAGKIRKSIG